MRAILVKIYIEEDFHGEDIEMFRVYKIVDLFMDPQERMTIKLEKGSFYVQRIQQNLKDGRVYLFEKTGIAHYEFWNRKDKFREKYLPKLLEEGWSEKKPQI